MVPAGRAPLIPRLAGASGRARLEAAGITPCADCRWHGGELLALCPDHLSLLQRAAREHVAKFPPGPRRLVWPTR